MGRRTLAARLRSDFRGNRAEKSQPQSVQDARPHAERGNEEAQLLVSVAIDANSTVLRLSGGESSGTGSSLDDGSPAPRDSGPGR